MSRVVTIPLVLVCLAVPASAHQPPMCRGPGDPSCNDGLLVANAPPPPPPPPTAPAPPPDLALESWTSADASMPWTLAAAVGPVVVFNDAFAAPGFTIGVGFRHFESFDPNRWSRSTPLAFATLGLSALPRGSILGNELGLDVSSRLSWVSTKEQLIETAVEPAFRVQAAGSRISLPSVLGTLLPAVGFIAVSSQMIDQDAGLAAGYEGLLLRWAFGLRYVALNAPVLLFAELEPTFALVVPTDGAPRALFGAGLQFGFTPMQN